MLKHPKKIKMLLSGNMLILLKKLNFNKNRRNWSQSVCL